MENKEWKTNNPEKVKSFRKRYSSKLKTKIVRNLRNRLWHAVKKGYKTSKSLELLGCTIPELKIHLEAKFLPTMTWENYGTLWHIDHITPCASFDLTDPEQQKKCFHYTNLQPLFAVTTIIDGVVYMGNLEKSDTVIPD